jgi:NTE family protein
MSLTKTAGREGVGAHLGLSLALQGGGSFGAFTWGVLDRLLEEGDPPAFDIISGASAGAVNAVLLADGLAEGGADTAREKLARVWHKVGVMGLGATGTRAAAALRTAAYASPFAVNPFGINPLRSMLEREVDFARLRRSSPVRLLISATRVRDGRARLFREHELTLDAVLASACLPFLHQPVEIDREPYWDGGYSANPPLRQLVIDTDASRVLLVRLLPEGRQAVPHFSFEIAQRVGEMAFNASLLQEEEAVRDLCRACAETGSRRSPLCRKLERLRFSTIAAEDSVGDLGFRSPLDTSFPFLLRLKDAGRRAAEAWIRSPGELGELRFDLPPD